MCLAIVKPRGVQVAREHLLAGWQHNPDGGGYAFVKDGKVVMRKGFMKLKDFIEAYEVDEAVNPESNFLIHFRITSQGAKTADNTHPFLVEGGALIHNGTMSGTGAEYGKGASDTAKFADKFKTNLTYDFVVDNKAQLDIAIQGSKIALLYDDDRFAIINERDGHWKDGVWYSNYSYKTYRPMTASDYFDEKDWGEEEDDSPWQLQ